MLTRIHPGAVLAEVNERTGTILPVLIGLFILFDIIVIVIIVVTVRRRKGSDRG